MATLTHPTEVLSPPAHKLALPRLVYLGLAVSAATLVVYLPRTLFAWRADYLAVWLTHEDGPYESYGALACLAAALIFGYLSAKDLGLAGQGDRRRNGFTMLLAIGLLLMFLEEISWGERIFSLAVPEWLKRANIQQEWTLHNLRIFHPTLNDNRLKDIWLAGSVVYLGILPLLALAVPPLGRALARLCVPLASWPLAVAVLVAALLHRQELLASIRRLDYPAAHDVGEAIECLLELAFLALSVGTLLAWRNRAPAARLRPLAILLIAVVIPLVVLFSWGFGNVVIHRDPHLEAIAWLRRGNAQAAQGQLEEALASFTKSLGNWPELVAPQLRIAQIAAQLNNPGLAADHFRRVLTLEPNNFAAHTGLGLALDRLGRVDEATREFEKAVALAPQNADAYNNLGVAYAQQQRWRQARDSFAKALALQPTHAQARRNLAATDKALPPRE
jgi:tetratricopeptide (TPR) repeat protein